MIEPEGEPLRLDPSRWRINMVSRGATQVQATIPAHCRKNKLHPANPNPLSVVKYDYDHTINSTIYICHEMGHALADELIRDKHPKKRGNMPLHMEEFQAYIFQHIIYDSLKDNPDKAIREVAKKHYDATMGSLIARLRDYDAKAQKDNIHSRPPGFIIARGVVDYLSKPEVSAAERANVLGLIFGTEGKTNLIQVLDRIGIQDKGGVKVMVTDVMDKFMKDIAPAASLRQSSRPAIAASNKTKPVHL